VRVVLAPDCFGGTLGAAEAAQALADGWREVRPGDELVLVPLSDGGPGFLDALPGTRVTALVADPLGRPALAAFLLDGTTAYVESAQAAGLHLLDPAERDPGVTSTYGVGQLVTAAVDAGATRVVVGLGGSATNDGGAGFVEAVGEHPRAVELVAATDVDNPLLGPQGATAVFAPQKGATADQLPALEARLAQWADVLEERLGVRARDLPGAGAAGGLGFALLALGARRVAGVDVVAEAVGLDAAVAAADLVVTGEGRLDGSSLRGKVVSGVAARALAHGVPCVAVAGEVLLGRREAAAGGLAQTVSLVERVGRERALADAAGSLRVCAADLARSWGV
jgi:glycerate kinase